MWADYYLRPNGEVVIVGEDLDEPEVDSVYTDRLHVLTALVWGSRRHPELGELIPARDVGSTDCRCSQYPKHFGPDGIICPECGGVGWLPAARAAERGS